MTIRLLGTARLMKKLEKMSIDVTKEVREEVARGAILIQNESRRAVQKGSKTGRLYKRGKKYHQASAKGESPATDSGRLVSHINFYIFRKGLSAKVGVTDMSDVRYARRLEFGGRDKRGVYIAPRPYIRPALRRHGKKIINRIERAVKKVTSNVR